MIGLTMIGLTMIGLTATLGAPVMCIVIFAGEELTYEQRMEHDIWAGLYDEGSIRDNSGPGILFPWKTCTGFNCLQPKRINHL
jgi:hypothetical protein